jgi:hypothetical protein
MSSSRDLPRWILWGCLLIPFAAGPSPAQVLEVNDDSYGVPFAERLVIEAFGVLDNDVLDGEPAGEGGATTSLVGDVSHGTLALGADGSFTYTPGASFDGNDSFVYEAVFGSVSALATVTLTACTGGPQIFACWKQAAFLSKAAELGLPSFREGFEDDEVWGIVRSPINAVSVVSQGIRWQANDVFRAHVPPHDPPASAPNGITTGSGAARTGQWGLFDPAHGYATGTSTACDVDMPADACLFNDGFTGIREPGLGPLNGVGGFFDGFFGANVAIVLDGDEASPVAGGPLGGPHQFFGAIDADPAGFRRFEFRELDGKVGQALLVFADDFTVLGDPLPAIPALPITAVLALAVLLAAVARRVL